MISLAIRFSSHLSVEERIKSIIAQLKDIGGARSTGFGKDRIRSLPDAVAKVLSMHYGLNGEIKSFEKEITKEEPKLVSQATQTALPTPPKDNPAFDICPTCGEATFVHEEGCKKCYGCGFSEC